MGIESNLTEPRPVSVCEIFDLRAAIPSMLGGEGWLPRGQTLQEESNTIWSPFGVTAECGQLRVVLLHRPGPEMTLVTDVRQALWLEIPDSIRAGEQHDALAELYRSAGVTVRYLDPGAAVTPNLYFMRDTFAMTPEGAILARPASLNRAGEERVTAQALANLGIPLVLSVHGRGTFEGADLLLVNEDLAFVACTKRTNERGAQQVINLLQEIGIGEIVPVQLAADSLHLDCVLSLPDRAVALLDAKRVPQEAVQALRRHGFRLLAAPPDEAVLGMSVNIVPIAPGLIVMSAHNPQTKKILENAGIECIEIEVSELMKGGGSIHCMTGVIQRAAI